MDYLKRNDKKYLIDPLVFEGLIRSMRGFDPSAVKTVEEVLDITEANVFVLCLQYRGVLAFLIILIPMINT